MPSIKPTSTQITIAYLLSPLFVFGVFVLLLTSPKIGLFGIFGLLLLPSVAAFVIGSKVKNQYTVKTDKGFPRGSYALMAFIGSFMFYVLLMKWLLSAFVPSDSMFGLALLFTPTWAAINALGGYVYGTLRQQTNTKKTKMILLAQLLIINSIVIGWSIWGAVNAG